MTGVAADYAIDSEWGALPAELCRGEVVAVDVAADDEVFVLTRGPHPILVFTPDGRFRRSFGEGLFTRAHGIEVTADDRVLATDDGASCIHCFTRGGRRIATIGLPGKPAAYMSGLPFCRCTDTAVAPDGALFVADGYGNASIHKYAPDGRHLLSWGEPGTGRGQFYIPHNLVCDDVGRVLVADRENHRIQLFDGEGRYLDEWRGLHRPCALCRRGGHTYVGEVGPLASSMVGHPNLGPRLTILDEAGAVVARIGDPLAPADRAPFVAPHGIAVDSRGAIYVADLVRPAWPIQFPGVPLPAGRPLLHKLIPQGICP